VDGDATPFAGLRAWIERAAAEGAWLIFAAHDVGDFPRQAMSAGALDAVCAYCTDPANDIWIDTVAAVGAWVRDARGHNPS
jgi:hypothetical protein